MRPGAIETPVLEHNESALIDVLIQPRTFRILKINALYQCTFA